MRTRSSNRCSTVMWPWVLLVGAALALQPGMAHDLPLPHEGCGSDSLRVEHLPSPQQYGDPGYDMHPDGTSVRRRRLAQESWGNLRIAAHYNFDGTNPAIESHLQTTIVPQAIALLEASLRVDSVVGNLAVSRPCYQYWVGNGVCYNFRDVTCGHTNVPLAHIADTTKCTLGPTSGCVVEPGGDGVADADFLVYVTAIQSGHCGSSTLACTWHGCGQHTQRERATLCRGWSIFWPCLARRY